MEIFALIVVGVIVPLSVMGSWFHEMEKRRLKELEQKEELKVVKTTTKLKKEDGVK